LGCPSESHGGSVAWGSVEWGSQAQDDVRPEGGYWIRKD